MPQKITLTGTPITKPVLQKSLMGKEKNATKVYAFEMREKGSPTAPKSLPLGSEITFTVFVNERQLKRAGLDEKTIMDNKIIIQGDIVIDISTELCLGELGVTTNQLQVIPPKEKKPESN